MDLLPVRGVVTALSLTALFALSASVPAQTSLPFPLVSVGADGATGLTRLDTDGAALAALTSPRALRLTGLSLGEQGSVSLDLTRMDLNRLKLGFVVNGLPSPGLLDGLDLSVWRGSVAGDASSDVLLSFSQRGSRGWISSGGQLFHLMPQPGSGGSWDDSHVLLVRESELAERGASFAADCGLDELNALTGVTRDAVPASGISPVSPPSDPGYLGSCSFWECAIAIETDFQLFSIFGDLGAETAYVTTLLAAVSARYEDQIDTVLTFPYVQFYTTAADPWSTPDNGGGSITMLGEFESAWEGAVPAGAVLGHFVSGANLGGGVAYLGALCDTSQTFSFAVSGNISGQVPFPVSVGPLNWDFMVFAHETGHNFNSPHTHDFSPQIDNCAGGTCITDGTVMSYCHQCPGGLSNITTFFNEPTVVNVMKAHANSCLPLYAPLIADASAQPTLIAPGAVSALSVEVLGAPVGAVNLNWRPDSGSSFTAVAMSPLGGNLYGANLPGPACGDAPEWNFSMVDATCGPWSSDTFSAEVGLQTVLAHHDLEGGSSWSVGAAGDDASTGVWVHGDPNGTGAQPGDDVTAGGSDCWFTGQGSLGGGLGENDVDGGTTTLTTSNLDLSSGDARIGYWRWYSNDTGNGPNNDVFTVQVSNGGAYVTVELLGPSGPGTSGGWIWHDFLVSDFVAPSSTVTVRFIASDLDIGSIVEAAIDELSVFRVDCGDVCQTDLGFGGPGSASLSICGGDLSSGNPADLSLTGATPSSLAGLFVGAVNGQAPFKGGTLVPVPWLSLTLLGTDGSGDLGFSVPGGNGPFTAFVQVVYPDGAQALGFGFSNGLQVEFLP